MHPAMDWGGPAGTGATETATVLFADVVDSTALRTDLGDDTADVVLDTLDHVVRQSVTSHHGRVVKSLGDGVMAVFAAASDAVAAAATASRGAGAGRAATVLRIGMSAGDVAHRSGDCHGTPVVEASRLCAVAEPGTIMASDVVRVLAGSRGAHNFRDRGAVVLKGIASPVRVVEVLWKPQADPEAATKKLGTTPVRDVGWPERYRLLESLGAGSEGEVWRARDLLHDRYVALKIRADADAHEARLLFGIRPHDNLPVVRDGFRLGDGRYVLVMDWVDGDGLPVEDVLDVVADVAAALEHLHTCDPPIVHGDVKPANLVRSSTGTTVLVDFGISLGAGSSSAGTKGYTAPELLAGGTRTPAADVYGLAATTVALLCGSPPDGSRPAWPGMSQMQADELEGVVRIGLAADPGRRPPASELAARLRRAHARAVPRGEAAVMSVAAHVPVSAWEHHPDDAAGALTEFDRAVVSVVAAHDGRVMREPAPGQAAMCVFTEVRRSIEAAEALHTCADSVSRVEARVRLRIGVHRGPAGASAGAVDAAVVSRVGAIRDAAAPGSTVLSPAAAAVAGRSLAPDGDGLFTWDGGAADTLVLPPGIAAMTDPPLVGRTSELDALEMAATGGTRIAFVTGEPGIGKTRLAAEFARARAREGWAVVYGRCDDGLAVPYQPVAQALSEWTGDYGAHASDLVRLVPDIALGYSAPSAPPTGDPELDRYRLFEAVAEWLANACEDRRVVFVVDDLQWATRGTLAMLRHLVLSPRCGQVLFVAAHRAGEQSDHLVRFVADMARGVPPLTLELEGLDLDAIATLVGDVTQAEQLVELTGGNAFFVTELVRSRATAVSGTVPSGVRDVVRARLAALGDAVPLETAAVCGREFTAELCGAADLDEAVAARILIETGVGRYRFAHRIVAQTVYDDMSATRRAHLHMVVARRLEAGRAPPTEIARHYLVAEANESALPWLVRAGEDALGRLDPIEAEAHFRRALELCGDDPEQRIDIMSGLGVAQRRSGNAEHRATLLRAAESARCLGDPFRLAAAATENSRGVALAWRPADAEVVAELEEARTSLSGRDDPRAKREASRVAACLAIEQMCTVPLAQRIALADEAVTLARESADEATLVQALYATVMATAHASSLAFRTRAADELDRISHDRRDPATRRAAGWARYQTALEHGDAETAARAFDLMRAAAEEDGEPSQIWIVGLYGVSRLIQAGRIAAAEAAARDSLQFGQEIGQQQALTSYTIQLLTARHWVGSLEEFIPMLEMAASLPDAPPTARATVAMQYADVGRGDEASRILTGLAAERFASFPEDFSWLAAISGIAIAAHQLADAGLAAATYELLLPYRYQVVDTAIVTLGPASWPLGAAAAAMGELDRADLHYREAAVVAGRCRWPGVVAYVRASHAAVLRRRGGPGDAASAERLRDKAADIATELGLEAVAEMCVALGA